MIRTNIQYNGEAFVALFARPNWSESVDVTEATLTEIETSRLGKEYRRSGAHAPAVSKISYTSTLRAQDAQDWRSFNSYLGSKRVVVPVWPDFVTYARRATMAHDSGFVLCWDTGFTNVVLTDSSTIPETEYVAPALIGSIKLNDDIPLTDFDGDVEIEVSLIPLTSVLAGYSDPFSSGYMLPQIINQPVAWSGAEGSEVTLSVTAITNDISGPLTYQWYFGVEAIPGATSASYVIESVASGNEGSYYVVVSNDVGHVQGNTVTVLIDLIDLNTLLLLQVDAIGNIVERTGKTVTTVETVIVDSTTTHDGYGSIRNTNVLSNVATGYTKVDFDVTINGDFTFEFMFYSIDVYEFDLQYASIMPLTSGFYIGQKFESSDHSLQPNVVVDGSTVLQTNISVSKNSWTHAALVRNAGTLKFYINGIEGGSALYSSTIISNEITLGCCPWYTSEYTACCYENVRISNIARYTANFTPPERF
jgi:hypothetical protein